MSAQLGGGRGGGRGDRGAASQRPEDIPVGPVSLRRVAVLFTPYRARLWLLLR